MAIKYVNVSFEKDFLRHILKSTDKLISLHGNFPSLAFSSSELRKVYETIVEFFERYGTPPTKKELTSQVDKLESKSEDEKETRSVLVSSLFQEQPPEQSFVFLKDELLKLLKGRTYLNTLNETGRLLEKGDLLESEKALTRLVEEPIFQSEEVVGELEFIGDSDKIIEEIKAQMQSPDKIKGIPTAVAEFDKFAHGMFPGELGIVLGRAGGFKSMWLGNTAIEAYLANYNVLFFTLEMPGRQLMKRLYGRIANIPVVDLEEAKLSEKNEEKLRNAIKRLNTEDGSKLFIVDVPDSCTPEVILRKIKEYQRKYKVDLVVIDYMQIMELKGVKHIDMFDWKVQATLSRQLKKIARATNTAIWSACQTISGGTASGEENDHSDDDIAFSKAIKQNADILLKLVQSKDDLLIGTLWMHTLKIRRKWKTGPIGLMPDPVYGYVDRKRSGL